MQYFEIRNQELYSSIKALCFSQIKKKKNYTTLNDKMSSLENFYYSNRNEDFGKVIILEI